MNYNEALGRWGAEKLGLNTNQWPSVKVDTEMDQGYQCNCNDPNCWGSFNEPASFHVIISAGKKSTDIDITYGFTEMLHEILDIAEEG